MMCGKTILTVRICGTMVVVLATVSNAIAANVVARPSATASRPSAQRVTQAASRMPSMSISTTATSTTPDTVSAAATAEPVTNTTESGTIDNKSAYFCSIVSSKSATETDIAADNLSKLTRDARNSADAPNNDTNNLSGGDEPAANSNICDEMLRNCIRQQCGTEFAKCAGDTDTDFGDKMDTCRRATNCTGHEYQLLATEIKADRDFNAKIANYRATTNCGDEYDKCITGVCGDDYAGCIGKNAGDAAISKCDNIAQSCAQYDSGLAMRAMAIFGELRTMAERRIAADEASLYSLREEMRSVCERLGAILDERSLSCVYTVNFRAGDDSTIYASKKLFAGSTFDCTPNWFGIDITTYRENALRATREQTAASSAMLGAGLGIATGAATSGAVGRAIDRYTADRDLDTEIRECMQTYGIDAVECRDSNGRWEKIAEKLRGKETATTDNNDDDEPQDDEL